MKQLNFTNKFFLKKYLLENNSIKQTLIKNTFWLMLGEVISKVLLFINTVLITRYLGVSNYGKYSFAFAFVAFFSVFVDFGFDTLIARDIASNKKNAKKYINNILVIKFILGLITFGLIFIAIQLLGKTYDVKILVYLATISMIIQSYTDFFQAIFQGYEKMQFSFIYKITFATFLIIISIFFVINKLSSQMIVVGYIIASFLTLLMLSTITRTFLTKFFFEFDFNFWKTIFLKTWPFLAGMISIMIYVNSDTILLSIFRNYKEVGLYQSAYKIFFAFQSINLIHQVIYPKLANLYGKKEYVKYKKLTKTLFVYSLYILIPTGILITILSKRIILIIYGKEFIGANLALTFLIWTGILIYFSTIWSNNLLISRNQKKWFYSALIGAVFNLVLNFIFIPHYGILAAAITTLISEIVVFLFIYIQSDEDVRNLLSSKIH